MSVNLVNVRQQVVLPVEVLIDDSLDNPLSSSIHLGCMGKTEVVGKAELVASIVEV